MVGEWTSINLGDVCTKIGSGATPRGGSEVYLATGPYALIRSQNVYNDGFRYDGLVYISEKHASELDSVDIKQQDVLLNITGDSVARACQVDPRVLPARVNQHVAIIRPDPERLDPRFLRYFLVSPAMQAKMLSWAGSGGTRNALTKGMIESFDVFAPEDIGEQRAIAHILGTLDDKIELNRKQNETLEAMARALFKAWFVDFEPVRAVGAQFIAPDIAPDSMDTRNPGAINRAPTHWPPHILDLFPDRLVDSELGEIPEGWEVVALGELVEAVKGRSYKSEELVESETALVTLKSFARGGGYRSDGLKPFAGTYKAEQVVHPGEVVIACTDVTQAAEVIGRPAIVRSSTRYRRLVASLDTLIVRPKDFRITKAFLYFLGGTEAFVSHTYAHTTGTTVLHLGRDAVPSFTFAKPPAQLVQKFDALAAPVLERIQATEQESETLAQLRDTLLPKLISGELRIKDAEAFLKGRGL